MTEGVFKSNVVMSHLIPYLSVLDYIQVRKCQRFPKDLITPAQLFWKRFSWRIRRDFGLTEEIACHLEKLFTESDKFCLTGGYLISVLRGDTRVDGQDIDVCFSAYDIATDPILNMIRYKEEYETILNGISRVGAIHGIQFIEHYNKRYIPTNIKTFDINLCRNMFSFKEGLKCMSLDSLSKMSARVDLGEWISNIPFLTSKQCIKDLYTRLQNRVEKYHRRGFDITVKIGSKKDVYPLFVCEPEDMPTETKTNKPLIFEIMGKHNPDSCVYTSDCRCKSRGFVGRWCTGAEACNCPHHIEFQKEFRKKWSTQRAEKLWEEYADFWKVVEN